MNPPKVTDEDYINFIIATPRDVTATEAERVQPESTNPPTHDAFTRLLQRLEPDAETRDVRGGRYQSEGFMELAGKR